MPRFQKRIAFSVSTVHVGTARQTVLALCVAIGFSCAARSEEAALSFRDQGRSVASRSISEITSDLKPTTLRVFDPHQRTTMSFRAFPLPEVLDQVYGRAWRQREAIVFGCLDGYEPTIPVRRVLEHSAFLAVGRPGRTDFTITEVLNGRERTVELGPFYVIWENIDDTQVRAEDDYGWPYQVTRIDLVSFRARFGEMVPSSDATRVAWEGFEAFVIHCSRCHAINGHGGSIGPELNYPANPTEYLKAGWLRNWIDDPTTMRLAPRMPPLNPTLPNRDGVIDAIIAYLEMISSHKVDPREQ